MAAAAQYFEIEIVGSGELDDVYQCVDVDVLRLRLKHATAAAEGQSGDRGDAGSGDALPTSSGDGGDGGSGAEEGEFWSGLWWRGDCGGACRGLRSSMGMCQSRLVAIAASRALAAEAMLWVGFKKSLCRSNYRHPD